MMSEMSLKWYELSWHQSLMQNDVKWVQNDIIWVWIIWTECKMTWNGRSVDVKNEKCSETEKNSRNGKKVQKRKKWPETEKIQW